MDHNDRYEKQGLTQDETITVDALMDDLQDAMRTREFHFYGDDRIERLANALALFVAECRPLNS